MSCFDVQGMGGEKEPVESREKLFGALGKQWKTAVELVIERHTFCNLFQDRPRSRSPRRECPW